MHSSATDAWTTRGWKPVLAFFTVAWAIDLLAVALTGRALFADGSFGLLTLLQKPHHFFRYDANREFASFIIQLPILIAERAHIARIDAYAALYAVGLSLLPTLAWLASLLILRGQPALFALSAAAGTLFGFGASFICSEVNLQMPLVWLAACIMLLDRPAPVLKGLVLPALAFALLRIYEGMLLSGPLLVALAVHAWKRATTPREQVGLTLAVLLFTLDTVFAAGVYAEPRDEGNMSNFALSSFRYLHNPQALGGLSALLAFAALFVRGRAIAWVLGALAVAAGVAYVALMTQVTGFVGYRMYYENRAFLVLVLPVFLAALYFVHYSARWWSARLAAGRLPLLLVPFAFAVAVDLMVTHDWFHFTQRMCTVLRQPITPLERLAALKAANVHTAWDWSLPSLSMLLRDQGSDAIVVNEPGQDWEPFDPRHPVPIPQRGLCQTSVLLR